MTTSSFEGHLPGSAPYRRLLIGLFCAGVATFAQLYAFQSVLPLVSAELRVPPATAALTVSAATLGLAVAVVPWSLVADRIGRVPAMGVGVVAATCFGMVAPLAQDLALILLLRLGEGIALGAVPAVALAYLAEEVHPRYVAAAAGSYISGTTVGGLSGRLVSGPLGELWSWQAGVMCTVALCGCAAALFLWLIPRSRGFVPGKATRGEGPGVFARLFRPLRSVRQLVLFTQGFLLMGVFVAIYNYLGFHLTDAPFLLPAWIVTLLFLAYLAGTLSSPIAGTLASRHGRLTVLLASIGCVLAGIGLMFIPHLPFILCGLIVFTAGFFGAHAVASSWTPVLATPETRGQASSLYYFAYYTGSSVGGWLLGYVFGQSGWTAFLWVIAGVCVLAALLAVFVLRRADLVAR